MFVDTRRQRLGAIAIVLLIAAIVATVAGFFLSFAVQLAYMTSHGSAWLSPTAERLRAQWYTGRALSGIAAALDVAIIAMWLTSKPPAAKALKWCGFLAIVGLTIVFVDIAFQGIAM